jgi:hypothetical protein
MTNRAFVRIALSAAATLWMVLLLACGGSVNGNLLGGPGECAPVPCSLGLSWDAESCSCQAVLDGGLGLTVEVDATADCTQGLCPAGLVAETRGGVCACVPPQQPQPVDASVTVDASTVLVIDASPPHDASITSVRDAQVNDASYFYPDASTLGYDGSLYCNPGYCGVGYTEDQNCNCVACPNTTCPAGQTPGNGCTACAACPYACPADFEYAAGCNCVPRGTDAGIVSQVGGPDAGQGCNLEGYYTCSAGSWCELGICPDNKTQYGCYCSVDGKATCDVECPTPPPCNIPGQGTCPYGATCAYGSCAGSNSELVCYCESNGQAYCYSSSCADGGPNVVADAGPSQGGVTCLLEGYTVCSAGSFCSLGTCPDGTTYGCFCNQDGTATCDLSCPPPAPCEIPGEGSCPYNTTCTYGTCSGATGTLLSCSCGYGGNVNCYTNSCGGGGLDGG